MANLKETAEWIDGIYQIEKNDPVVGGEGGISNRQAEQLANRTGYLKKELEKRATTESPVLTGTPTAPTPAQSVNNQQIATTAFVKATIAALVGSAPATLDTLAEIATALGNDSNLKQALLGEINKKSVVSVIKGVVGNGSILPLPSGCNESQCHWIVSMSEDVSLDRVENTNTGYTKTECYVDSNRRVVARVYSKAGANNDSGTGKKFDNSRANYLVIGVK
ncbi:hypothetical protein [Mannheimia indoligenes]|uniref:hypothetical protein n=1 Tax=Mannheimia indoligenes TaxID=3103145 RepID=UPI002FE5B168